MSFEIVNTPEPTPTETPDVTPTDTPEVTPTEVPEVPEETPGDNPEPTPGEGDPDPDPKPGEGEDKPEPAEPAVYWYGEGDDFGECEIAIADDVRAAFEEKGLDVDALAAELYSKEGGFTLSEGSMQKLYDAFGKFAIDSYLASLKVQNDAVLAGIKAEGEAQTKADADRYESLTKDMGGDEGWKKLEEWALATLTDEELDGFNEVMRSGNMHLQQYALRDLNSRMSHANGVEKVDLIEGNAQPSAVENGPLSAADYQREMIGLAAKFGRDRVGYSRAQAALDARRRAGMSRGL